MSMFMAIVESVLDCIRTHLELQISPVNVETITSRRFSPGLSKLNS